MRNLGDSDIRVTPYIGRGVVCVQVGVHLPGEKTLGWHFDVATALDVDFAQLECARICEVVDSKILKPLTTSSSATEVADLWNTGSAWSVEELPFPRRWAVERVRPRIESQLFVGNLKSVRTLLSSLGSGDFGEAGASDVEAFIDLSDLGSILGSGKDQLSKEEVRNYLLMRMRTLS